MRSFIDSIYDRNARATQSQMDTNQVNQQRDIEDLDKFISAVVGNNRQS